MWFAGLLVACNGKGDDTLLFEDANNYEFAGSFSIESVALQERSSFCMSWDSLTTDIRGRPVDPTDVDQIAINQFDLDEGGVLDELDTNQLDQADAAYQVLWTQPGGETTACANDFEVLQNYYDPSLFYLDEQKTWLVSLLDLDNGTNDALSTVFVIPSDETALVDFAFSDSSARLDYDVSIADKPPLRAVAGEVDLVLDWSGVTTDVNGRAFDSLLGDQLLLARYDDLATVADVEGVFLQLDTAASHTWTANVRGETDIDLSTVEDANNNGFPGFEPGVWLVAISCTQCTSPVPLLLAWIEVQ